MGRAPKNEESETNSVQVRGYIRESYSGEKKTTWAVKRVFRSHRTVGINVLYAQRMQQDRLQLNLKNFSVAGNQSELSE